MGKHPNRWKVTNDEHLVEHDRVARDKHLGEFRVFQAGIIKAGFFDAILIDDRSSQERFC